MDSRVAIEDRVVQELRAVMCLVLGGCDPVL